MYNIYIGDFDKMKGLSMISNNSDRSDDIESYAITPKGFVYVKTGIDDFERFNKFWKELTDFVKEQAIRNGGSDGTPALVFTKQGGTCVFVKLESE